MTLTDGKEFTTKSPHAAGSHFDGGLTLEGTQQLMVLFSASRDAGTSSCCPGKRHLRTFCDCTEHPVQVVLTMTVSVAICPPPLVQKKMSGANTFSNAFLLWLVLYENTSLYY